MARSKAVVVLSACSLLVACGGATPPPENPTPPEPKQEPKPAVEPKEEPKAEEPKKEETPPPPAPELPKSAATIGGVSISEIDPKALVAAVQKAGWAPENVEINHGTVGKYESVEFGILKGTDQGKFNLVRRAAMPSGSSGSMMAPKDLAAMHKDSAAVYLDETADVVVWIKLDGGKPAVAKKALDSVLKK